jgi:hypothetical protein
MMGSRNRAADSSTVHQPAEHSKSIKLTIMKTRAMSSIKYRKSMGKIRGVGLPQQKEFGGQNIFA